MRFIILFFLLTSSLFAQQWTNISPFNSENYFVAGNFVSEDEGWAIRCGMYISQDLYHTYNGGDNWEIIYTLDDTLEFFLGFYMIDNLHGWATKLWRNNHYPYNSYTSYIKTSDGGYSWDDMSEYLPDHYYADPFYFINQDIGFFCAGQDSVDHSAIIYKTIDGGYNWYLTDTPIIYLWDTIIINYNVNKFFFLDENLGWAACSAAVDGGITISTSDGGETWEAGLGFGPPGVRDIHFVSPNYGGIACRDASYTYLAITEDNFESVLYEYDNFNWNQLVEAICFQNDSTIWVTGNPGIINRSVDGGATFDVFQQFGSSLKQIQFFNNTGYIFGSHGRILKYVEPSEETNNEIINKTYRLQNYPNPFNPNLTITYSVPNNCNVSIEIYNLKGQLINTFDESYRNAGYYSIFWDGKNQNGESVSSGIYYLSLIVDNVRIQSSKSILLK